MPRQSIAVCLARIVMPFSRSRSPESITRSTRAARSPNAPEARSMASTRVVLPWSTCATMATLRRRGRAPRVAEDGSAGAAKVEVLTSQGSPPRGPPIPGGHDPRRGRCTDTATDRPRQPPLPGPGWPKSPATARARQPPPWRANHRRAPTATCRHAPPPAAWRTRPPHLIAPNVGPRAYRPPHSRITAGAKRGGGGPRSHRAMLGGPPHTRGGQRRGRTTAPGVIRPCRGRPRRGPRDGRSRRARRVVGRRDHAR